MKRAVAILIALLAFVLFAYIAMDCGALSIEEEPMNVADRAMALERREISERKAIESGVADRAMALKYAKEHPKTPKYDYFDVPIGEDLQNHIFEVCESYGIHPAIIISMIEKESSYVSSKVGDGGDSFGLLQIQPRWHKERMVRLDCYDLLDPYQNVMVGVDYLAELVDKKRGMAWALMAYNGGPTYANAKLKEGVITQYVWDVLERGKEIDQDCTS